MSAYADVPPTCSTGARAGRDPDPQGFLPGWSTPPTCRDTLAAVADHRLTISAGRVEDVVPVPAGFELRTRDRVSTAATVVLAHGNQAPAGPQHRRRRPHRPARPPAEPWDLAAIRARPVTRPSPSSAPA